MDNLINRHDKIASIVCTALTIEKIDTDTDLIEGGFLDSLALVQLMVALEEGFGITIPPAELDIEDYRSVEQMSKLITRLLLASSMSNYG